MRSISIIFFDDSCTSECDIIISHVSSFHLKSLSFNGLLGNVKHQNFDYAFCELDKYEALPFNNSTYISFATFDLVHTDI